MTRGVAALLVLLAAPPAGADATGGGRVIECYCTDTEGDRVEMGEIICLHVGGRSFTAQCQMSLNVPMWRELNEGCLSSSLAIEPRQPALDAGTVHAHVGLPET
ncbi:hypothetical protein [Roseivivax isoporae]|uniref:hypothetical protein n=1 Tax=Roseivivax isoporae TaxID=591206 RepID=UPI0009FEC6BC|nr:hypothetical protein [Roseivivax isoporae]